MSVKNQPVAVVTTELAAADASKVLLAADTAAKYNLLKLQWTVFTSAAQAISVTIGSTVILRLPSGLAAGSNGNFTFGDGKKSALNEALTVTPAAAGPGISWVVEYQREPV